MKESNKIVLNTLLRVSMSNAQSTTGKNLRNIALLTGKWPVSVLCPSDAALIDYFPPHKDDLWRVEILMETLAPGDDIASLSIEEREFFECICTG